MELHFLGTGGGRFTMIKQLRRTAGMHLVQGDHSLYIDPGPGALVHAVQAGIDLSALDAILVSHAHLDHCGDMNVMIEAMTDGGDADNGALYASESVVRGAELPEKYRSGKGTYGSGIDPVLDGYHRGLVPSTRVMTDEDTFDIGPYTVECLNTRHSDPTGIAYTLDTGETKAAFITDTGLFDAVIEFCADADVIVMNVARPADKPWKGHLTTADAATILNEAEPGHAVLHHFGAAFIYGGLEDQREWLADRTDVPFALAQDGMRLDLDTPQQGLDEFF